MTDAALDLPTIESQIAIIRSSALLRRVVDKERLVNDPEFGGARARVGASDGLLGSICAAFSRAMRRRHPRPTAPRRTSIAEASRGDHRRRCENVKLRGRRRARRPGLCAQRLLHLRGSRQGRAPRQRGRRRLCGRQARRALRGGEARLRLAVSDRLVELRQQLRKSEEAVARFRADNNLVAADAGRDAESGAARPAQRPSRPGARGDRGKEGAARSAAEDRGAAAAISRDLPDIANAGAIAELRKQANDLSRQEAELLARYTDRHPSVVNLRAQMTDVHRAIGAEAQRLAANIQQRIRARHGAAGGGREERCAK